MKRGAFFLLEVTSGVEVLAIILVAERCTEFTEVALEVVLVAERCTEFTEVALEVVLVAEALEATLLFVFSSGRLVA